MSLGVNFSKNDNAKLVVIYILASQSIGVTLLMEAM